MGHIGLQPQSVLIDGGYKVKGRNKFDWGKYIDDAITLEEVSGEFIVSFETDGSMSPKTAFMKAVEELAGRFGSLEKDLTSSL